jgi:cytochrome bd ubiquinol oxidase subunit II
VTLDLVPLWAFILALSVFMYVLLDGFDLGVGILFLRAPDDAARDAMVNSVAPIWDGNETWLVMGGIGLLSAFPLAFAVLMPALYFPILFMLVGLLFRGVAFEFRGMPGSRKRWWERGFHWGSLLATFAQGVVLGNFIQGLPVLERHFSGGSFYWVRPFPLLVGVGLVFGYGLLGACWLVLKTEGPLQDWARRQARWLLFGVLAFIAMVSVWTPIMEKSILVRWFAWPNVAYLAPVPVITGAIAWRLWRSLHDRRDLAPFLCAMGLFLMCYLGLGISLWPMVVPWKVTLWDAAASPSSQAFLALGTLFLLPIIVMYTAWSYWVFRGKVRADTGYHAH